MFDATTGTPAANASVSTMPKLSPCSEGAQSTSACASSSSFSCSLTRPSARTPCASSSSGATSSCCAPTSVSVAGTWSRSASKALSSTGSPLRPTAWPMNTMRRGRAPFSPDDRRGAENGARPLRIVFIGQAVGRKGLPVLLSAFEALRDQVPATLTLVGAQHDEVAPLLLETHGVRALGRVSEQEKLEELAHADVLCAPSLHGESFGMVLTEAFAAGVPVVASNIAGYRDVVRDGREGILVAPGDAVALAQALRTILLDEGRRAEMAAAARERARRFGWPRVAAEVVQCYEQAVAIGTAPTRRGRLAVRYGVASADLKPREPRVREPAPGQR